MAYEELLDDHKLEGNFFPLDSVSSQIRSWDLIADNKDLNPILWRHLVVVITNDCVIDAATKVNMFWVFLYSGTLRHTSISTVHCKISRFFVMTLWLFYSVPVVRAFPSDPEWEHCFGNNSANHPGHPADWRNLHVLYKVSATCNHIYSLLSHSLLLLLS